jgi:TPR repeat protein
MNPENAALIEKGWGLVKSATYDPRYLAQHSLIGVVGDETKARSWYQRASELGSTEASRILARTDAD